MDAITVGENPAVTVKDKATVVYVLATVDAVKLLTVSNYKLGKNCLPDESLDILLHSLTE